MRKVNQVVGVTTLVITALVLGNASRSTAIASTPAECVPAEDKCWYDCDTGLPGGPESDWCFSGSYKWDYAEQ